MVRAAKEAPSPKAIPATESTRARPTTSPRISLGAAPSSCAQPSPGSVGTPSRRSPRICRPLPTRGRGWRKGREAGSRSAGARPRGSAAHMRPGIWQFAQCNPLASSHTPFKTSRLQPVWETPCRSVRRDVGGQGDDAIPQGKGWTAKDLPRLASTCPKALKPGNLASRILGLHRRGLSHVARRRALDMSQLPGTTLAYGHVDRPKGPDVVSTELRSRWFGSGFARSDWCAPWSGRPQQCANRRSATQEGLIEDRPKVASAAGSARE
jgi:hypothetical protein